jgi:D-glycero-D-manno-heptose 1,7-bisphosphate phosphatase
MMTTPLLFLDLDGTVRQGKDDDLGRFVNGPDDVVIFPEAIEMMRRWVARDGRIIGVTNQGGVSEGHMSLDYCMETTAETHVQCDLMFELIVTATWHPGSENPLGSPWFRKPSPGMIFHALDQLGDRYPEEDYSPELSLFVGDRETDRICAERAGVPFMWASEWRAMAS